MRSCKTHTQTPHAPPPPRCALPPWYTRSCPAFAMSSPRGWGLVERICRFYCTGDVRAGRSGFHENVLDKSRSQLHYMNLRAVHPKREPPQPPSRYSFVPSSRFRAQGFAVLRSAECTEGAGSVKWRSRASHLLVEELLPRPSSVSAHARAGTQRHHAAQPHASDLDEEAGEAGGDDDGSEHRHQRVALGSSGCLPPGAHAQQLKLQTSFNQGTDIWSRLKSEHGCGSDM